MKTVVHLFIPVPLLILCFTFQSVAQNPGRSKKAVKAAEAMAQSAYNRGFYDGDLVGYQRGRREAAEEAYERGRLQGRLDAVNDRRYQLADSILTVVKGLDAGHSCKDIKTLYDIIQKQLEEIDRMRADVREQALREGRKEGQDVGYRQGLNAHFDSVYTLNLKHGQNIRYPNARTDYSFIIDYESIAKMLGRLTGKSSAVEKELFGRAFQTVNIAVLEYLVQVVELTPKERNEVFERYNVLHESLAKQAYAAYLRSCQRLNRDYDKNFYSYNYSISTQVFLDVVCFNISTVADVTFTYAKKNSQFAAWAGFEIGHISELLQEQVMIPLQDYFRKNAIRLDYDQNLPLLVPGVTNTVSPVVAETRWAKPKLVVETVQLAGDHTVTVVMEIMTMVEVGYSTEEISIYADHTKQNIWVAMSNKPRVIYKWQDYRVVSVISDVEFQSRCSFATDLSKNILDGIFNRHRDPVESLEICFTPLTSSAIGVIKPFLTKALEPAIHIPYSCYEVFLDFGGRTSNLINVVCP